MGRRRLAVGDGVFQERHGDGLGVVILPSLLNGGEGVGEDGL